MFMSDVSIIVRKMRAFAERGSDQLGIGFPEQLVLMHLAANGSSNQDAIAASLNIDKGAVAKTVAKLEEKGLVTREVNAQNKREKLVSATPAAARKLQAMTKRYERLEEIMFSGLSPEEREALSSSIARVAKNLSESEEQ